VKKKGFNCSEQVLIGANEILKLHGFSKKYLKIASGFGGGVSRRGSICGAVSGGIMALGLKFGTDGTENIEDFDEKRMKFRELALNFMS
jgi:C_GCAxxG_C_C family probable redox protein